MASHPHNSPQGPYPGHHRGPPMSHHPNGHPHPHAPTKTVQEALVEGKEEIYMRMGRLWENLKNEEVALESYDCAIKNNAACVPAMMAIANILKGRDQYAPAIEYYTRITKYDEGNGEVWANLGHCFLMIDSLNEAYHAYQTALYHLQDLSQPRLWYGIGILYDRYGSLEHAEEAFSQVMRMAPDFEKANEIYFRLGIIYKQQQKYAASLDCFRYIVSNPPKPLTEEDIWFQLGHVYEQQKDYPSAKDAYKRVLDRDPKHAKVLQQLGWLHHQQSNDYNNQERAIEYLEKSVASDQNDAQSWYLLGRCYMAQTKYPKAYEAYQQAVYRDGRNPTFWCSIGVLYYQINQYRDALDAYSRAIRLNPNISEVWYDLGTLYESCNNQTADALDAYQRAFELDPTNIHIKARLDLLRRGQESGAPMPGPQELHPQAYQPAAMTGPPQPQWGATGPAAHAPPRGGQAPQLDYSNRLSDIQSNPPQGPQQVQPYEHRDGHHQHLPGPPKPQSPRQDMLRHYPPNVPPHYPGEPHPQRRSPSPKSRNPQSYGHHVNAPPPPPHLQQHQPPPPGHGQLPPNRISNPNYESHGPPQHIPPPPPPPAHQHGYNRSPVPDQRVVHESRPASTGANLFPPPPPHHRATPGHPPQVENREREETSRTPIPKRHREWDDEPNSAKSQHVEEKRPRLDDDSRLPSMQHTQQLPSPPRPYSSHNGDQHPPQQSRQEESRRLESYHPSEAAHHPPSQQPHQHPPPPSAAPKPQPTPPQHQSSTLPPPPPTFSSPQTTAEPQQSQQQQAPSRPKESPPRVPQESAARKMDVDENYDDDEEDKKPISIQPSTSSIQQTNGNGTNSTPKRESPRAERDVGRESVLQEGKVEA